MPRTAADCSSLSCKTVGSFDSGQDSGSTTVPSILRRSCCCSPACWWRMCCSAGRPSRSLAAADRCSSTTTDGFVDAVASSAAVDCIECSGLCSRPSFNAAVVCHRRGGSTRFGWQGFGVRVSACRTSESLTACWCASLITEVACECCQSCTADLACFVGAFKFIDQLAGSMRKLLSVECL